MRRKPPRDFRVKIVPWVCTGPQRSIDPGVDSQLFNPRQFILELQTPGATTRHSCRLECDHSVKGSRFATAARP
jgi:hypothetical protein